MIDYAMMKRESPKLKAKLTRAKRTGDYDKVKAACLDALRVWDKAGAWPDNWMVWTSRYKTPRRTGETLSTWTNWTLCAGSGVTERT